MEFIQIAVSKREKLGTANANRLRREGDVPAVLYGLKRPNVDLSIGRVDMQKFLRTGSHLVELKMGDKVRPAILREVQVDATTDRVLHLDFARVDGDAQIETDVPVNWKGRAQGEGEGGVFSAMLDVITVKAKPADLPRQYTVDIHELGLDETITIADLEARPGVTFIDDADTVLGRCAVPTRGGADEAEDDEVEEAAAEGVDTAPTE